jgi:hypothetical protein
MSITYTQSGLYFLVATNQDGCTSQSPSIFYNYIEPSSTIKEAINNLQNLTVYPNPSNGSFTLSFYLNSKENIGVSIENILGQELVSETLTNTPGLFSKTYDVKSLPKGVYILSMKQNNKATLAQKIILQ